MISPSRGSAMSEQSIAAQSVSGYAHVSRVAARLCTFFLAAVAGMTLTFSAYMEAFRTTRTLAVFVVLIALHLLWHRRFIWRREFALYLAFLIYMFITLLWTHDVELAMNTLVPALTFLLVMIFFGSLISFHYVPAALFGIMFGFALGAANYTITRGFPFHYPEEFSYNSIAGMYLFGLFAALMCSCFKRSHFVLPGFAVVIMLHIVATTSIKTNLGIALGLVAAGIMYFRHFGRILRRRILILAVIAVGLGIAVLSNRFVVDAISKGAQRVSIGVKVLEKRGDVAGYSGFGDRDYWRVMGIEGWKVNPVFGYGTEAFRDDYGITSHSTPIDVMYNFGIIGLVLFYGIFASLLWRLLQLEGEKVSSQRALILAGIVCYVFVSLSGTLHYNDFLAAFAGISVSLLAFPGRAASMAPVPRRSRPS
jgi:hypothetical protein